MIVPLLLAVAFAQAAPQVQVSTGPAGDDRIMGILNAESKPLAGEFSIKVPQAELRVKADGFPIVPAMGLTTWVSFSSDSARGELVLLENEAAFIVKAAEAFGFRAAALERRYFRETPRVVFLPISARGPMEKLQDSAQKLLAAVSDGRRGKGLQAGPTKAAFGLDPLPLQAELKLKAKVRENVVRFERPDGSWLAFAGADDKAAVAGILVSTRPVPGIETAALPGGRLSIWGVGRAGELARALKPFFP